MRPAAVILPCGTRLHLQHGPIDLIVGADGTKETRAFAFSAATQRFETVLEELVCELDLLRTPLRNNAPIPEGHIAKRMHWATQPHSDTFITRMAAVAGSVADTILNSMITAIPLNRAYVNNGGDIAIHLSSGTEFKMAMSDINGRDLGRINISYDQRIGGVATSGRHGRSLSMGIADSVTVLAACAAQADAATTLIANAVDLPHHPQILRCAANLIDPDSDLGQRPVVTGYKTLSDHDIATALNRGTRCARSMQTRDDIAGAALFLNDGVRLLGNSFTRAKRSLIDA